MRTLILVTLIAIAFTTVSGRILNVPDQFPTIQTAIDSSANGDTVLVAPGTYHERINFNGHNITLASNYLITGDTTFIASTIIDGDSAGTVVTFNQGEDSTAALCGMTIQNGVGYYGGGVSCMNSASPFIRRNTIKYCFSNWETHDYHNTGFGGGIYCSNSHSILDSNFIINNRSYQGGGGLYLDHYQGCVKHNTIQRNSAEHDGAGISVNESELDIYGNLISENGQGNYKGALFIRNSKSRIFGNKVISNFGFGIFGGGGARSDLIIYDNFIGYNSGDRVLGNSWGICAGYNSLIINNVIVGNNGYGANGVVVPLIATLINNTIINNEGLGVSGMGAKLINCICRNNAAPQLSPSGINASYCNIEGGWPGEGNIDIDPAFRDTIDADYRLKALICGYELDSPCIDAGDSTILDTLLTCDWGVGTSRSDMGAYAGGLLPQRIPIRITVPTDYSTIQGAINAGDEKDTILVLPGSYPENINFFYKNIVLISLFPLTNDITYMRNTEINGGFTNSVITLDAWQDSSSVISGFTISRGKACYGGGIHCESASPKIIGNIIRDNQGICAPYIGSGGGIYLRFSNAILKNNYIFNNHASYGGGAIYLCDHSCPLIDNNLIVNNLCSGGPGYTISSDFSSTPFVNRTTIANNTSLFNISCVWIGNSDGQINNTIIWNNEGFGIEGTFEASYSDIQDTLLPGEGNMCANPMFGDISLFDFQLMSTACGDSIDSPCIDAGDPAIIDSLLNCDWGLGTERSDIGIYGMGTISMVSIGDDQPPSLPLTSSLSQNYPNPFNPATTIKYDLPSACRVRIDIYDILGRRVATLADDEQAAGTHQAIWNAQDKSSGIYFYRIQAGEFVETKKMMLMK